jgi:hypothetical protein
MGCCMGDERWKFRAQFSVDLHPLFEKYKEIVIFLKNFNFFR